MSPHSLRETGTEGEAWGSAIAVVGLSCRLPGQAATPQGFWDLLCSKKAASSKVPESRFNVDGFRSSNKGLNTSVTESAHFLQQDVAAFDSAFFHTSNEEAQAMDPQQRMMLEVVYEASENAGISMERLTGSQTTCIVGSFTSDYREMMYRDLDSTPRYAATGTGSEALANRVSWFYDLRGPSFSLGSACSSSLAALHVGCQSLRTGEAEMAIVGGCSLLLDPWMFTVLSNQNFLAPDGRCKAFDAEGNGYGRGEGIAAVLLKRVDDAIRDGDNIRAVIRGTGINQDGKTTSLTLPSVDAQRALIESTYKSAGLKLHDTNYFEAHGTGTRVGDPIELQAISETFGRVRSEPLLVGSVKTNIGHLEAAAGLAALIKGVMVLETGIIPPSLHFMNANPKIPFETWKIAVPTSTTPWPSSSLRRMSVNAFGYGGTNAHAIVDDAASFLASYGYEAPQPNVKSWQKAILSRVESNNQSHRLLFLLSAHDQDALLRQRKALASHLQTSTSIPKQRGDKVRYLTDLAFTLSNRRSRFPWKSYFQASSLEELAAALTKTSETPVARSLREPLIGFVFTGQGAQWAKMGMELLHFAKFNESVQESDKLLKTIGSAWSAIEEFDKGESDSRIDEPEFSQPLCTVLQLALVDLLGHWNIRPTRVAGHSSGEIAAAYCLGVLSKKDALKAAFYRGILSSEIAVKASTKGSMMAVGASEEDVSVYVQNVTKGEIVIACINSPQSVTVSGDVAGIDELEASLKQAGIFARKLKVAAAYHSHHMDPIAMPYWEAISSVVPRIDEEARVAIEMHSSVTGEIIDHGELGPANWVRNLLSPVQFNDAVSSLLFSNKSEQRKSKAASVDILLEVGPHSALRGPLQQIFQHHGLTDVQYASCLSRGRNSVETLLDTAGYLLTCGVDVAVEALNSEDHTGSLIGTPQVLADLPLYQWNHSRRFWSESRIAREFRHRKQGGSNLLGAEHPTFSEHERTWRKFLRLGEEPWIRDHKIQGSILYPAAGFMALAIEAARSSQSSTMPIKQFCLRDVMISNPIVLTEDSSTECIIQLRPHKSGTRGGLGMWTEFQIAACEDARTLRECCSGLVMVEFADDESSSMKLEVVSEETKSRSLLQERKAACNHPLSAPGFYKDLEDIGLEYGSTFQNLVHIGTAGGSCYYHLNISLSGAGEHEQRPHIVHPSTLDAMFHAAFAALRSQEGELKNAMVPKAIDEFIVAAAMPFEASSQVHGFVDVKRHGFRDMMADFQMFDSQTGNPVVKLRGLCCTEISTGAAETSEQVEAARNKRMCSKLVWKPAVDYLTPKHWERLIGSRDNGNTTTTSSDLDERAKAYSADIVHHVLDQVSPAKIPSSCLMGLYRWLSSFRHLAEKPASYADITDLDHSELKILQKLRLNAEKVFSGQLSLSELLQSNELASEYLKEHEDLKKSTDRVCDLFDLVLHTKPNMSVLELGAGTTCIASRFTSRMAGHQDESLPWQYLYTHPDPEFLNAARKNLSPHVSCQALDISSDTSTQGFAPGSFDVIVASMSLGAQRDIEAALIRAKKLLKADGYLCLIEVTNHSIRDLALSLACNWWEEHNAGDRLSLLSIHDWEAVIEQSGFSIDFQCPDLDSNLEHRVTLMVTRPIAETSQQASGQYVILTSHHQDTRAESLSDALSDRLGSVRISRHAFGDDIAESKETQLIVVAELDSPILQELTEANFNKLKTLVTSTSTVLWISDADKPWGAIASGMSRSVRNEIPGLKFRTLQISQASSTSVQDLSDLIVFVTQKITPDNELMFRDGMVQTCRMVEDTELNNSVANLLDEEHTDLIELVRAGKPQKLCIQNAGMLDSFRFETDDLPDTELEPDEIEIDVKASGLNFRDVMVAMGQIPDRLLGFEASGDVVRVGSNVTDFKSGDRVCTLGHGAHRGRLRNKAIFCQRIPNDMSHEAMACFPLVHSTAYHALVNIARVKEGQSILIHAAAGGVGQAAIQLAQHFKLEIFATVGSQTKKEFIQHTYGIDENHILHSRDLSFEKGLMRLTDGRGVDVVLNSLSGDALQATWRCIAPFGSFVEIGIKDILANSGLSMQPFLQDASFTFLNLEHLARKAPDVMGKVLQGVFEFLRHGIIKPVMPLTVHPVSEVEKAFRHMQAGKHLGKIALTYSPEDIVPTRRTTHDVLKLDSSGTYMLVGGLGGLGRSLSTLLVRHGARSLCFVSRSGGSQSDSTNQLVQDLEDQGIRVTIIRADVSDDESMAELVKKCKSESLEIKGVIQCAMVLRDVLYEKMTYADWTESTKPKIQGTANLSSSFAAPDFFITLSSFAGIFGNRGQSNYAAGCAFQDAIAHDRRAKGMNAVTIDLGIMRDVGVIAEQGAMGDLAQWEEALGIRENDFHALMIRIMAKSLDFSSIHDDSTFPAQIVTGLATGGTLSSANLEAPYYLEDDPRFSVLRWTGLNNSNAQHQAGAAGGNNAAATASTAPIKTLLAAATSVAEAETIVMSALVAKVAKSLQTSPSDIDTSRPLHSYGVDSLVAVEMRNWIFRELKAEVTVFDILSAVPMTTFVGQMTAKSKLMPEALTAEAQSS